MKNCSNCAWYCHWSGKCYAEAIQEEIAVKVDPDDICKDWAFDGLSDEERKDYTLMAMEMAK